MTDTFTTPNGTTGATMKPNALFKWFLRQQARALKKPKRKAPKNGVGTLLLRTVGRKSGNALETPVAYWPQADGTWLVCASAAGAQRHPAWYFNLAASATATIWVGGEQVEVAAAELHGEERARAWELITRTAKGFLGYTKKTDRVLPVIRLTRR
ncbi:MAG: nitroreductase family deazaflavin-dependent oxidoreductase [Microbacteriaceae bacterium]|nr:nitroreductase family deazaflavin-dependent oxidoreductase [Microbacteriaceae bacterium]